MRADSSSAAVNLYRDTGGTGILGTREEDSLSDAYEPVQCSFHDVLEDAAVRRRTCVIRYRDEDGTPHEASTTIRDIYARDGAEYARLGNGTVVRLDRLDDVESAGAPAPTQRGGGSR